MRQLGFWGGRPAPRKSAIFAVQDGKIPDSPPRGPALRGPRRRGYGGAVPSLPPPLPGPSRPLTGGCRGSCGGGSDSQVRPPPGDPPAAYLSTPGRPPSPGLSLRGLCGDPRGSAATPCGPAPAPGPGRASLCVKVNFREGGGPAPPAEGASGRPPFGAPAPNEPPGAGQDPPIQSRASRKIAPSELTRMAGVEPSKRHAKGFRDSVRPPR